MNDPKMWEYWRDKKGFDAAVDEYFAEMFAADPRLSLALAQVKNGMVAIDQRMRELAGEE